MPGSLLDREPGPGSPRRALRWHIEEGGERVGQVVGCDPAPGGELAGSGHPEEDAAEPARRFRHRAHVASEMVDGQYDRLILPVPAAPGRRAAILPHPATARPMPRREPLRVLAARRRDHSASHRRVATSIAWRFGRGHAACAAPRGTVGRCDSCLGPADPSPPTGTRAWNERTVGWCEAGHVDPIVAVSTATGRFVAGDGHLRSEIGSVTKLFTALLLARMAEQGVVALTDRVGDLLPPGTPLGDGVARIPLESLACHRSGLPRLPRDCSGSPCVPAP